MDGMVKLEQRRERESEYQLLATSCQLCDSLMVAVALLFLLFLVAVVFLLMVGSGRLLLVACGRRCLARAVLVAVAVAVTVLLLLLVVVGGLEQETCQITFLHFLRTKDPKLLFVEKTTCRFIERT